MTSTPDRRIHGYEAIADTLAAAGVDAIFGLMGEDIAGVIVAAQERGIEYVDARHENQVVAMADGYSRVSGRVGVAAITGGPGFSNALTALNTAHRARSSIVVVTGDADAAAPGMKIELKHYPQEATCATLGIPVVKPVSGAAAHDTQHALLRAANQEAVVLLLTSDVLSERLTDAGVAPLAAHPAPGALAPGDAEVAALADLLRETWAVRRPVIVAGRGAVSANAGDALRRLGELTGALLATSLRGVGYFAGDPFDIGIAGSYSNALTTQLLREADCVLAFGAAMNSFTTYDKTLFPEALLVQVDTNPSAFGRYVVPDLAVQADARLTAEALVAELERREHAETGYRSRYVAERLETFDAAGDLVDASTADRIDPRLLMFELDRILPDDRILTVDGGRHTRFSIPLLPVSHPHNFAQAVEGGAIGLGIGLAIGAATARRDATVVLGVGDAGMLMSIGDLETAVRHQLPLVILVHNDQALGAEVSALERMGLSTEFASISTPSFAAIANAMGAEGYTVRSVEDLAPVATRLTEARTVPMVLDCLVNPDVRV